MHEEKKLFSVYVHIRSWLKEGVEMRLMFLLHSDLWWMRCVTVFSLLSSTSVVVLLCTVGKSQWCSGQQETTCRRDVAAWFCAHTKQMLVWWELAKQHVVFHCLLIILWSHVLYWPQSFVAKAARCLCWSRRLMKRNTLKDFPASKCWNKWVSELECMKGLGCVYLFACKRSQ